eukprot:615072-Pelagomonas_calceolata.AAC.6
MFAVALVRLQKAFASTFKHPDMLRKSHGKDHCISKSKQPRRSKQWLVNAQEPEESPIPCVVI